MNCENYKAAIIETVAASAAPGAALQEHLDACPACHAAFERERSFFAAIDTSLRATANAELPASFLPSVRARLVEAVTPQRRIPSWVLVGTLAGAAMVAIVVIPMRSPSRHEPRQALRATPMAIQPNQSSQATRTTNSLRLSTSRLLVNHKRVVAQPRMTGEPEVLVPDEERLALEIHAQRLRGGPEILQAYARPAANSLNEILVIPSVEISEVEVKSLWE